MKRTTHLFLVGFLAGITVWGISVICFTSHPGRICELKGIDYLFYLRGSVPPPKDIIIIAIDEASFSELKLPWPWPRKIHAQLIRNLKSAGAKIIAFDVLFADPTKEEDDIDLAQAIKEAGNVILTSDIDIVDEYGYRQIKEIEPISVLRNEAAGIGSCTLIYDPDNIIRRSRLKFGKIKSFAYEVLRLCGVQTQTLVNKIDKDVLINFTGPARNIETVSYYQAINYKEYLPKDIFKDKIVLIGRVLTSSPQPEAKQPDMFPTPKFSAGKTQMAGIEVIANFIDTVHRGRYIQPLCTGTGYIKGFPRLYLFLALLLILIILSVIEIKIGYIGNLVLTILSTIIYGGITHVCFAYKNILLPVFMPIAGFWLLFGVNSLTKYFLSEQEKKYIKYAFQKYVPASVVKKILEAPEKLKLGGDEITGTVLFSDLEKFTTVSEKLKPEKLVSFINEYLSEMSEIIFKYNGTITRFIGDAILAIWGAPVWHEDHAVRAVHCALEMTKRLKELNIEWKFRGLPELKIRIGINTGSMVVGNVGSKKHMDYTAMGDSVNLASRLEETNKLYGTDIIIGHSTYELVNRTIKCRELDIVTVKGREGPVQIYEPIGRI